MKFYERKEIKDILAYLKLIINPSDSLSLRRIINTPPRGIGEKTIEKIEGFSKEKGISLYEGMREAINEDWLSHNLRDSIRRFVELIEELREEAKSLSLSQLTLMLLSKTGYIERLKEEGTEEAFSRIENIDELVNVMVELEAEEGEVSLETFLDKVSLVTDVDLYEDKENRVSLMTLHCAKGLEFPVVFMIGMEDGLLPHYRRGEEIEDLEEERRLCYVRITRAKEKLYLSRSEKRSTFGVGRINLPSRFLEELPMEFIRLEGRPREEMELYEENEKRYIFKDESSYPEEERILVPEGFFSLRVGMRVRHPKFGEGKVRSVEGLNEDQKAMILFNTVGYKLLKVKYANLEILE